MARAGQPTEQIAEEAARIVADRKGRRGPQSPAEELWAQKASLIADMRKNGPQHTAGWSDYYILRFPDKKYAALINDDRRFERYEDNNGQPYVIISETDFANFAAEVLQEGEALRRQSAQGQTRAQSQEKPAAAPTSTGERARASGVYEAEAAQGKGRGVGAASEKSKQAKRLATYEGGMFEFKNPADMFNAGRYGMGKDHKKEDRLDFVRGFRDDKGKFTAGSIAYGLFTLKGPANFLAATVSGLANVAGLVINTGFKTAGFLLRSAGDSIIKLGDFISSAGSKISSEPGFFNSLGGGLLRICSLPFYAAGSALKPAGTVLDGVGDMAHTACQAAGFFAGTALTLGTNTAQIKGFREASTRFVAAPLKIASDAVIEVASGIKNTANHLDIPGVSHALRGVGNIALASAQLVRTADAVVAEVARGVISLNPNGVVKHLAGAGTAMVDGLRGTVSQLTRAGEDHRETTASGFTENHRTGLVGATDGSRRDVVAATSAILGQSGGGDLHTAAKLAAREVAERSSLSAPAPAAGSPSVFGISRAAPSTAASSYRGG